MKRAKPNISWAANPFVWVLTFRRVEMTAAKALWRPSIFMPRWACRLMLQLDAVRVERLQDIHEEDAMAEGLTEVAGLGEPLYGVEGVTKTGDWDNSPRVAYRSLWDSINGGGK